MPESVESMIRVRYAETDQMSVVYYGNYFTYFEVGRVEWCRANGFNYRDMERDDDAMLIVAEASCRYKAPARFDDLLSIRTSVKQARPRLIVFKYEIRNAGSGRLLATGETTHFIIGRDLQPKSLPEKYHAMFGMEEKSKV